MRLRKPLYQKKLKASDIILVSSVRAYHSALTYLNKLTSTVIIFDSPALLRQHAGMQILDVNASEDLLKYSFSQKLIDYEFIHKLSKQKLVNLEPLLRDKNDLLEEVIKTYTVSGLLDKFNTYIYATTTPLHRDTIKTLIVKFFFGNIKEEVLLKSIAKYTKDTPKNNALLQPVIAYMATPPGQQLQKALAYAQKMENEASKNSRRAVAYKKIGEMFGVDHFELRIIILLYRSIK